MAQNNGLEPALLGSSQVHGGHVSDGNSRALATRTLALIWYGSIEASFTQCRTANPLAPDGWPVLLEADMIDKPYELILAEDLIEQVQRRLGDFFPGVQHLAYRIETRKADLPAHLQGLVPDDWLWHVHYPFWVLSRLAKAKQVRPSCWIRSAEIYGVQIATSDLFGLPPEIRDRQFEIIGQSWLQAHEPMVRKGHLRIRSPRDLDEHWLGMLEWRLATPKECDLMGAILLPEYAWTPLYRYQDINRICVMLWKDATAASPFGDTPTREIRDAASKLREKYGLRIRRLPRTYHGSKTQRLRDVRLGMIQLLQDKGYSESRMINEFGNWGTLATEFEDKLDACREAVFDEPKRLIVLARELGAPLELIQILQELRGTYSAQDLDEGVFQRDERTLRRDWKESDLRR